MWKDILHQAAAGTIRTITAPTGRTRAVTHIHGFARNTDVDVAWEDFWGSTGVHAPLEAATALEIVSADAADAAAGTGARTVKIWGMDGDWALQEETVTLNGTTAVDLANTYLRVFKMEVVTAGTGDVAAGAITLRIDAAGATQLVIPLGGTFDALGKYTIPDNYTGYLLGWRAISPHLNTGATRVELRKSATAGDADSVPWVPLDFGVCNASSGVSSVMYPVPIELAEKTDLQWLVYSTQANQIAELSWDLLLVADEA